MPEKKYVIGGKTYIQRPLVLGQIIPLMSVLEGIVITRLEAASILMALGPQLSRALAVVLIPEGNDPAEKDVDALASEFERDMSFETALEVAADFLSFSATSSLFEKMSAFTGSLRATIQSVTSRMPPSTTRQGQSETSSANSPAETSPNGTGSPGTSPGGKRKSGRASA